MSGNININFVDRTKQEQFDRDQKIKEEKIRKWEEEKKYFGDFSLYYRSGYFDENGKIEVKLFREYAEDIVEKLRQKKETATKIRQYYNIVNDLYSTNNKPSKEKFYIMLAKANYDLGRGKLSQVFYNFLKINIDLVFNKDLGGNDDKTKKFKIFKKHFEAIIAYSKGNLSD